MADSERLEGLAAIMDRLRDPSNGCPWDLEQSYASLRAYLLEECYEVADALDRGDPQALCEELGDLLFQIVFLSRLAKEDGSFTIADVVRGIAQKMVRRHPHIFGEATADTAEEVVRNWEAIKRREKGSPPGPASVLDGIPPTLPALSCAQRLGDRASRAGFDWDGPQPVVAKLHEELDELRAAVEQADRGAVEEELGDLLFTAVMLARKVDVDPEAALARTNMKFRRRFAGIERELAAEGLALEEADLELLERLWASAKRAERE